MLNEISIRFSGEQGSGVQFTGQFAANYFSRLGYHVFAINDFESRIRGGYSFTQIRIGVNDVNCAKQAPDILIPFSLSVVDQDLDTISEATTLIIPKGFSNESLKNSNNNLITFEDVLQTNQLRYINTFYVALLTGIFNAGFDILKETIKEKLNKKPIETLNANIDVAETGYKYGAGLKLDSFKLTAPEKPNEDRKAMSGALAISAGIAAANCRFYSAYPMSPSTSIIEHLSDWAKESGIITEQAEDEISAMNLALGASYAGVRAMTGTSGGGMALMGETVSLAAVAEVPIVIANAQRPGPATGLPTRTEQGDLLFTLFMGHGEFTKIILAPGTQEKSFELAQKAFYLADKYQVPVFILSDQYLMDGIKTCPPLRPTPEYKERFIDMGNNNNGEYLRYKSTDNGVSPRMIPGLSNTHVTADCHAHDESGLKSESGEIKADLTNKLLKKRDAILNDISTPWLSQYEPAKNLVIGWGSSFGVINDALKLLNVTSHSATHMHFHEVYPLDADFIRNIREKHENVICVENNATGQFASLLKMEADIKVDHKVLKYNGRPFYLDELAKELERKMVK